MGGADFSDRAYTYAEVENDTELASFALTSDDFNLKVSKLIISNFFSCKNI